MKQGSGRREAPQGKAPEPRKASDSPFSVLSQLR